MTNSKTILTYIEDKPEKWQMTKYQPFIKRAIRYYTGRFKQKPYTNKRSHVIQLNLTDEEFDKVNEYCREHNTNYNQAIREMMK